MPSMSGHVPLRDPNHDGVLSVLPREIRDKIYRLLVKGSYLDTASMYRYSGSEVDAHNDVQPDFAILQLSKSIGREATEILYSESVFRFVITTRGFNEEHILIPDNDRMKRLAPMIQNVVLDIHCYEPPDPFYEMNMGIAVQNFGGLDIRRRSLLVRLLDCSQFWSIRPRICEKLKAFVGFRTATLEVLPSSWLLLGSPVISSGTDDAENGRNIREIVAGIAQAVAEELEPVLGPAVSGFRFHAENLPPLDSNLSRLRDFSLIAYLEFHSDKHSVENPVAKEDKVQ